MTSVFKKAFYVIAEVENDAECNSYDEIMKGIFGNHFEDYGRFSAEEIVDFPAISEDHISLLRKLKEKKLKDITAFYFSPFYKSFSLGLHSPQAIKTLDDTAAKFGLAATYELFNECNTFVRRGKVKSPSAILSRDLEDKVVVISLACSNLRVNCREDGIEFRVRDNLSSRRLAFVDDVFRHMYGIHQPEVGQSDILRYSTLDGAIKGKVKILGQG